MWRARVPMRAAGTWGDDSDGLLGRARGDQLAGDRLEAHHPVRAEDGVRDRQVESGSLVFLQPVAAVRRVAGERDLFDQRVAHGRRPRIDATPLDGDEDGVDI